MPPDLAEAVRTAYGELCTRVGRERTEVAVRSSATAEDLPDASFAGQQASFLNVSGADEVVAAVQRCFASLFTDRAIIYREEQGFDHLGVALSAGVQRMVRSDLAGAGVALTIDTETGFDQVLVLDGAWGLGEAVVAGEVDPDSYVVFKPLLSDTTLATDRDQAARRQGGQGRLRRGGAGEPSASPPATRSARASCWTTTRSSPSPAGA